MEVSLKEIKELNPDLNISNVRDQTFTAYGQVLEDFPFDQISALMTDTDIPDEGNHYVASDQLLESGEVKSHIQNRYYGGMDIQIGFCNGMNSQLGGLEFHKGSEINVAITDFVLLLGDIRDITQGTYQSTDVEAYFVPKGTAIEIYQTTLHLAPCKVGEDGFKCVVILPEGTNTPFNDLD